MCFPNNEIAFADFELAHQLQAPVRCHDLDQEDGVFGILQVNGNMDFIGRHVLPVRKLRI